MDFINENILRYSEKYSQPESELLKQLERETNLRTTSPRMLSGHIQGRFLSFLANLMAPFFVLEIGTFTGYSALCLAEGLQPGGQIMTIDPNEETNHIAKKYFAAAGLAQRIAMVERKASEVIPGLSQPIDMVFIDADKKNYSLYFDLVVDKVRKGGLIVADNVLWSGKVLDEKKDEETRAIHEFNEKVAGDKRVAGMLLPVRDGLMLLRKIV
jgi:caffeoyl-CoA O-methyltransferase